MTELLRNARAGWYDFTTDGKIVALLLISLLFLWIYYKKIKQRSFLIYVTAATICCVVPVTAAVLMLYQTRFYDYEWVWTIVPITAMVGYSATVFITDVLKNAAGGDRKKEAGTILLMAVILILCSGMGTGDYGFTEEQAERKTAEELLKEVENRMEGREIYLWAPGEITEYAREYNGGIRLLYGRNMWDPSLDAYAYDIYPAEYSDLDIWMRREEAKATQEADEEDILSDSECAEIVASTEVNCILLSAEESDKTKKCFEETLGASGELLGDYYLIIR